jgi:tRNA dimethylallyltransferase
LAATRQLAKRQLTWLRSEPRKVALDSLAPGLIEQAVAQINEARFFPE